MNDKKATTEKTLTANIAGAMLGVALQNPASSGVSHAHLIAETRAKAREVGAMAATLPEPVRSAFLGLAGNCPGIGINELASLALQIGTAL